MLKIVKPHKMTCLRKNFSNSQILKRTSKLGALSLFAPNNVIHKYYHISFLDCLWRLNLTMFKRKKQIWLHEFNDLNPSRVKRFIWFLNTYIFQNGCSKDHHLFIWKEWRIFQKKEKEKKKSFSLKIQFFLNYVLTWSSTREVRRQPFKGPVPIT